MADHIARNSTIG